MGVTLFLQFLWRGLKTLSNITTNVVHRSHCAPYSVPSRRSTGRFEVLQAVLPMRKARALPMCSHSLMLMVSAQKPKPLHFQ